MTEQNFINQFNKSVKVIRDSFPSIEQVSNNIRCFSEELKKQKASN